MSRYNVRCATDITGFGVIGHATRMAQASGVTIRLRAEAFPVFPRVMEWLGDACIPGAAFRNLEFAGASTTFHPSLSYERKMLLGDAQSSGGLFFCIDPAVEQDALRDLRAVGLAEAAVVGEVQQQGPMALVVDF
jgi:selenide,water dikinase